MKKILSLPRLTTLLEAGPHEDIATRITQLVQKINKIRSVRLRLGCLDKMESLDHILKENAPLLSKGSDFKPLILDVAIANSKQNAQSSLQNW